jgi:hypothetical protein
VVGEYKYQKADNATYLKDDGATQYTFKNVSSAYYASASVRPALADNKIIRNLELAGRYSFFNRPNDAPWGGSNLDQTEAALDYWLHWNSVVKLCYFKQRGNPAAFSAQVVFGF